MISVAICQNPTTQGISPSYDMPSYRREEILAEEANTYHEKNLVLREQEVISGGASATGKGENMQSYLRTVDSILPTVDWRSGCFASSMAKEFAVNLQPLEECVRCILWEIMYSPIRPLILEEKPAKNLAFLLRSAVLHQMRTEDVSAVLWLDL